MPTASRPIVYYQCAKVDVNIESRIPDKCKDTVSTKVYAHYDHVVVETFANCEESDSVCKVNYNLLLSRLGPKGLNTE